MISNRYNQNKPTEPEKRATQIRKSLLLAATDADSDGGRGDNLNSKNPDLCFFQEVWGSGFRELLEPPILQQYQVPHQPRSLCSFLPTSVTEIVNSIYLRLHKTGGLFDLASQNHRIKEEEAEEGDDDDTTNNIKCVYRHKHTFTISVSKSLKGVEATLWKIPTSIWNHPSSSSSSTSTNKDANKNYYYSLLVFNTHLDPSSHNNENRALQIKEILQFMKETFQAIDENYDCDDVNNNNNNGWRSRTGVLLVGDFNIKANSMEYHETFLPLCLQRQDDDCHDGWNDFFRDDKDNTNEEEETYARTNSLAVCPEEYGRIDYIFGISKFTTKSTIPETTTPMQRGDENINEEVRNQHLYFLPLKCQHKRKLKQPRGQELSDHYPLLIELVPKV